MDKVIFEFSAKKYDLNVVKTFDRLVCEHLSNVDEKYVTKFDFTCDSFEDYLNDNYSLGFKIDESYYRVFGM